jgi:hypothetical protein
MFSEPKKKPNQVVSIITPAFRVSPSKLSMGMHKSMPSVSHVNLNVAFCASRLIQKLLKFEIYTTIAKSDHYR